MGWGYGINAEGREIGYNVSATCDHPDCNEKIHRGLAYVCGDMHDGGDYGCGKYFCYDHLVMAEIGQICQDCCDVLDVCGSIESCKGKEFNPDDVWFECMLSSLWWF